MTRTQVGTVSCNDSTNCCDPDVVGDLISDPGGYCFDEDDSVEQITRLREGGVLTYVIGVPGSELFEDLMNEFAQAGGTARDGSQKYFDVNDIEELDIALGEIAAEVAQSCRLELQDPPTEAVLLNVYLDGNLLPAGHEEGWVYDGGAVLLQGAACDRVQAGEVQEIRVVSGCSTVIQ